MAYKDNVDLYFTAEGDFRLDEDTGDLEDTRKRQYRGFIQRLLTRMMSRKGDWRLAADVGANIWRFAGQPNTRETGEAIKRAVYNELTNSQLVRPSDMIVEVVPISEEAVAIVIFITPPGVGDSFVLNFTYSLRDNFIVPRNI